MIFKDLGLLKTFEVLVKEILASPIMHVKLVRVSQFGAF